MIAICSVKVQALIWLTTDWHDKRCEAVEILMTIEKLRYLHVRRPRSYRFWSGSVGGISGRVFESDPFLSGYQILVHLFPNNPLPSLSSVDVTDISLPPPPRVVQILSPSGSTFYEGFCLSPLLPNSIPTAYIWLWSVHYPWDVSQLLLVKC